MIVLEKKRGLHLMAQDTTLRSQKNKYKVNPKHVEGNNN